MILDDLSSTSPRRVNLRHLAELAGYNNLTDAIQVNRWNGETSVEQMEEQLHHEEDPGLTTLIHEVNQLRRARARAFRDGFSGLAHIYDQLIATAEGRS